MSHPVTAQTPVQSDVDLNRDIFMRNLLRHLAGTLEDVVGIREASGYISIVGQHVGNELNTAYRDALQVSRLDRSQVSQVLVDLKHRIEGDFYIVEETEDRIVLGNRACPFGDRVRDRPSMCMMTSNVFGVITAENLGYARVELNETIAQGHDHCRVIVYLKPSEDADQSKGREYYQSEPS